MAEQAKKTEVSSPASSLKFQQKAGAHKFSEHQTFLSEEATDLSISKCTGVLQGEGVMVTSRPDIVSLIKLGSYGKGVFSRSVPCHGLMPSFSLPPKRERTTKVDPSSADASRGLSRSEQEMVRKISKCVDCKEKRVALHEKWKKESNILSAVDSASSSTMSVDVESGSAEEKTSGQEKTSEVANPSFTEHKKQLQEKWEHLETTDQYKMDEYLQLSSEEALYLSHELNLLNIITDNTGNMMSPIELWEKFYKIKKFLGKYAAYRYYRQKGWVPKSGIKYGVDFVLYKHGPVEYHSKYGIIVRLLTETEAKRPPPCYASSSQDSSTDVLTWRDVVAFDRVCSSVTKDLILCHVIMDDSLEGQELEKLFPECLEKLKIVEVLVKRWDPDKNR